MRTQTCRGFNLIEFVVVVVVMSVGAVALLGLYSEGAKTFRVNEQVQTAAQMAQACSEHILALRRGPSGYTGIPTGANVTICDTPVPLLAGYSRAVTITEIAGGTTPCPAGAGVLCKRVQVAINRGATQRAQVTFMVVN